MGLEWVLGGQEFVYSESMAKRTRRRQLRDAYRFKGFIPGAMVVGIFGDPTARVLPLGRRQKKRLVACVAFGTRAITTRRSAEFEIYPVATPTSIWRSRCGG